MVREIRVVIGTHSSFVIVFITKVFLDVIMIKRWRGLQLFVVRIVMETTIAAATS